MELDDLKNIWKTHDSNFVRRNEIEIAAMLKGTSKTIISKLKRSVWFELGFTLIGGIALLIYAFTIPNGPLKWTSVSIPLIFVGYSIYYIKKLILLNNFDPAGDNIRENIEKLIHSLSAYLRFYKRSYTVLYPVYFILGIVFRILEVGARPVIELLMQPKTIALLTGVAIAFYFSSTWFVDWLLKKLYGNHLDKLKGILHDLHEKQES